MTINIYASAGELVRTISPGFRNKGSYLSRSRAAHWDGRDENGELVAAGIYFYQIQAGSFFQVGKMVLKK